MKRFIFRILLIALIVCGSTQDSFLWSYRLFLDSPTVHNVSKGEYLSKLSLKYYGTPDYWRELALINRAPNPDLVYPEEGILIPDLEAVKELKKAKTITAVNSLVEKLERTVARNETKPKVVVTEPVSRKADIQFENQMRTVAPPPKKDVIKEPPAKESGSSSIVTLVLMIIGTSGLVGAISFFIIKRLNERKTPSDPSSGDNGDQQLSLSDLEDEPEFTSEKKSKIEEKVLQIQ